MAGYLVYFKLEIKRAVKRIPNLYFGAIMLLFLMGMIALLSSRMLYQDAKAGRIAVGVVMPEDDTMAKQVVAMLSSLDSVKSICDFRYLDRQKALDEMEQGSLTVVLEVPEGFVQDIISGMNTPVRLLFPANAGIEGRIFKELADAGAKTLAASQAGIYAGDELCMQYQMPDAIPTLEADLNRIYLGYSMMREDYFRHYTVSATGDLDSLHFFGISAGVLFLLLMAIPVSGYLAPASVVLKRKLTMIGIGAGIRVTAKVLGLFGLFLMVLIPGLVVLQINGFVCITLVSALAVLLTCLSAAALVVFLYQLAGNQMSGIMLLFLVITGQHFLAGGFLPEVFLPAAIRQILPWMPSAILMEGAGLLVSLEADPVVFMKLAVLLAGSIFLSAVREVEYSWK